MTEAGSGSPQTGSKRPVDELWASIETGIIAKIKSHPFITGLIDGSLKEDTFRYNSNPQHVSIRGLIDIQPCFRALMHV
jgi:hypothetical protein